MAATERHSGAALDGRGGPALRAQNRSEDAKIVRLHRPLGCRTNVDERKHVLILRKRDGSESNVSPCCRIGARTSFDRGCAAARHVVRAPMAQQYNQVIASSSPRAAHGAAAQHRAEARDQRRVG